MTFAAQAGSMVMQHKAQSAQADYQAKANDIATRQFEQDAANRQNEAQRQRMAEYQQSASEVNAQEAAAMRERSTLDALLGEYGAGHTAGRRMAAIGINQGQDLATISDNGLRRQQELGFAESADVASIRSRVTTLPPVQKPSTAGLALGIAGSALQFGSRMNDIRNPKPGAGTK